ncbi:MAG: phenylalanine--tRNA ligase subunit alpha [Acidobacteriota bacterium]|nr:phenylalanine--tRNA ligase subunit alpha [Acidobacteriota bacterium]
MAGGDQLAELTEQFDSQASSVADREAWESLRLEWVGKKQGRLRSLMGRMKDLAPEERRDYGQGVNRLKQHVEARLEELDEELRQRELERELSAAAVDVTLPGRRTTLGTLHPVSLVAQEMEEIFAELGYSVAEGPEIEDDFHNFEALNFPHDHPARDTQDTLFLDGQYGDPKARGGAGRLLRTHTSPVQIRTMLSRKPPIRVICPGRVFRHDNDLRHSPMFHQVECLAVDEGITIGDLKGTLEAFIQRLFSADTGVRLRPSFFPFTEPSAEVDITCPFCEGSGCQVCSQTGWMEILGSGMVDPRVLSACGIDPERYSGFAFGLGIDRVAMIRYGIPNIRMLFDNDLRLLQQIRG